MAHLEHRFTPENQTMMQGFEWYVPPDQKHWQRLVDAISGLKAIGINTIWLPPGCKASSPQGNGYDIYDLYDLGEFEQKGSRSTKWGSKEDLMHLVDRAEEVGISLCWDAVLNHKAAADYKERCLAVRVDPEDRNKEISKPYAIEAWLGYEFPGRRDRYSSQKYHWYHFSGTDWDDAARKNAIYKLQGKQWSKAVAKEHGNYDYLMFGNLDYSNLEVREDVKRWIEWIGKETRIKAVRFDAVKHYSQDFLRDLLYYLDRRDGVNWFLVGEYWRDDVQELLQYLERLDHKFSLFDVPLAYQFSRMSMSGFADLRLIFDKTLVKHKPHSAVTFVMNHDTQPSQSLEADVAPYFKPLAYALILLRKDGYPCIFYGDLYGIKGPYPQRPACKGRLPDLCRARKLYSYGTQNDYFDSAHCIGWTREGTWDRPNGLACIMSNGGVRTKTMYVGERHQGEVWTDVLGWSKSEVKIDAQGNGVFPCRGTSVSVYVSQDATGRNEFGKFDADIYETGEPGYQDIEADLYTWKAAAWDLWLRLRELLRLPAGEEVSEHS